MRSNAITLARVCLSFLLMVTVANARIHKSDIRVSCTGNVIFPKDIYHYHYYYCTSNCDSRKENLEAFVESFDGLTIVSRLCRGIFLWEIEMKGEGCLLIVHCVVHYDRMQDYEKIIFYKITRGNVMRHNFRVHHMSCYFTTSF